MPICVSPITLCSHLTSVQIILSSSCFFTIRIFVLSAILSLQVLFNPFFTLHQKSTCVTRHMKSVKSVGEHKNWQTAFRLLFFSFLIGVNFMVHIWCICKLHYFRNCILWIPFDLIFLVWYLFFNFSESFIFKGLNPDYVNFDTLPSFWPNDIFNSLQFQSIKSKYNFKWKFWKYGIIRKQRLFYCICFGWDSVVPILREIRFQTWRYIFGYNLGFRELILCRFHLL